MIHTTSFGSDGSYSFGRPVTATMNDELKKATDIRDFLKKNKENMIDGNLTNHLNQMLADKDITVADVVRGSYLDRGYVYQIFSGKKTPSRDKLIAIAFGMHLSGDETQKMLKISGNRELYARDARDAIILFSLQRKMPIYEANSLLDSNGFKLLGNLEE